MKNLQVIIIAAACFMSLNLLSQNVEKSSRLVQYGYFGIECGYLFGLEESYFSPTFTLGFKKGFEFSVDYKENEIDDPNFENYNIGIPFFAHAYEKHGTEMNIISFNFGKSIYSNEKMRIVLSGGPSYINSYRYDASGGTFLVFETHEGSQTKNKKSTGFDAKAKFDLTGAEVVGASLVLNANFNEVRNYYGVGLALTFGKMK